MTTEPLVQFEPAPVTTTVPVLKLLLPRLVCPLLTIPPLWTFSLAAPVSALPIFKSPPIVQLEFAPDTVAVPAAVPPMLPEPEDTLPPLWTFNVPAPDTPMERLPLLVHIEPVPFTVAVPTAPLLTPTLP